MHKILVSILSCLTAMPLSAGINKASAQWLSQKNEISAAERLKTVIVMDIDDGWHTYWTNPGEGGMRLSINPDLPEGWQLGEIQYPAPIRFMTGQLPGFGYEGRVLLPLDVIPPKDFEGEIPALSAKLSWLTCNDESCIPGNSDLKLSPSQEPSLVENSYNELPLEIQGAQLSLEIAGQSVILTLSLPENSEIDPTSYELFPATEEVMDPAATVRFEKDPKKKLAWTSIWPKNEYCKTAPDIFTLVLKKAGTRSLEITTK